MIARKVQKIEEILGTKLIRIKEGLAQLYIPDLSAYTIGKHIEPAWAPVFYNPRMKISRDIDVVLLQAYHNLIRRNTLVCDALSATGVRGIRYSMEVDGISKVVLNDIDTKAFELIKLNCHLNNVIEKTEVKNLNANYLFYEYISKKERFDIIDIDPFGTPVPFLESALRAIKHKGALIVTATDLAPLMGTKIRACIRKYQAIPMNVSYSRELGIRILIGHICREAAKYELGIKPLFSYSLSHFIRIMLLIERSRSKADKSLEKLGYVIHCPKCRNRALIRGENYLSVKIKSCPRCGYDKIKIAGPLWCDTLWDKEFVREATKCYNEMLYLRSKFLDKFFNTISEEVEMPCLYYSVQEISKELGTEEISPSVLIDILRNEGYRASRTHLDNKGVRTDATFETIISLLERNLN